MTLSDIPQEQLHMCDPKDLSEYIKHLREVAKCHDLMSESISGLDPFMNEMGKDMYDSMKADHDKLVEHHEKLVAEYKRLKNKDYRTNQVQKAFGCAKQLNKQVVVQAHIICNLLEGKDGPGAMKQHALSFASHLQGELAVALGLECPKEMAEGDVPDGSQNWDSMLETVKTLATSNTQAIKQFEVFKEKWLFLDASINENGGIKDQLEAFKVQTSNQKKTIETYQGEVEEWRGKAYERSGIIEDLKEEVRKADASIEEREKEWKNSCLYSSHPSPEENTHKHQEWFNGTKVIEKLQKDVQALQLDAITHSVVTADAATSTHNDAMMGSHGFAG
jgi:hypothetical protein